MKIIKNSKKVSHRILLGIPTLGKVRYEWAVARYGQIIPINWQMSEFAVTHNKPYEVYSTVSPIGFLVHDAYNLITKHALTNKFEWLLCLEDDTIPPPDLFIKIRQYIEKNDIPIVSGLYFTKSEPAEPQTYRGRGTGAFHDWKLGQKVWVDGVAMGCLLIHTSILQYLWDNSETYRPPGGEETRKVFETPRRRWFDPQTGLYNSQIGTQDLFMCDRIINEKVLQKTGWKKVAKKKYPFLVDTTIFCRHIDLDTGRQYP